MMMTRTKRKPKPSVPARAKANGRQPKRLVEMTVEAIERKWPDRWVLIQVTREEQGQTTAGLILGHVRRKDRSRLDRMQVAWHLAHPGVETFLFWTGDLLPKDVYVIL